MGLMDILNGMQNGPRGQQQQAPAGSGGGMSPMTMALLGLLAYKAIKGGGLGNILGGGRRRAHHRPAVIRSARHDGEASLRRAGRHPGRYARWRCTGWPSMPTRARQPRLHPADWATSWAA